MKDNTLRNYQQQAKEQIFSKWNVADNILYQMPTGTGKTRLFTSIIRDINLWGLRNNEKPRLLIIAHRSELIEQIDRSLSKYHIPHGIIASILKYKRDYSQSVQVASIQTISHSSNRQIVRNLGINYIIIDEAHHAIANSYYKLWKLFPYAKKLGVTATPWRMNNEGFCSIFDIFIPSMPIKDFIKQGWLAPYKYYSIPSDSFIMKSIDSIKDCDIEGDYKISALEHVIDVDHIRVQLLTGYKKYALGKKGIIYSISREHSNHICQLYQSIGVHITSIDSTTPTKKREMLINDFKKGDVDIIVNVDIFSEGFDCPDIEFIQLARPTKSLVKYIQQVGRGLRKNGDKECIILDHVGLYTTFGLPDAYRDWNKYYYGDKAENGVFLTESKQRQVFFNKREIDMTEGDQEMVLIQDTFHYSMNNTNVSTNISLNDLIASKAALEVKQPLMQHFTIKSKPFFKGKYIVENNEDGFFLCNVKNGERLFLLNYPVYKTGRIVIRKINSMNTIIRVIPTFKNMKEVEVIIGFIKQEGKLLKFSSFDASITDKRIDI